MIAACIYTTRDSDLLLFFTANSTGIFSPRCDTTLRSLGPRDIPVSSKLYIWQGLSNKSFSSSASSNISKYWLIITGLVATALTLEWEARVCKVTLACLRRNDLYHPLDTSHSIPRLCSSFCTRTITSLRIFPKPIWEQPIKHFFIHCFLSQWRCY